MDCTELIKNYSRQVKLTKLNISSFELYSQHQGAITQLSDFEDIKAYLESNSVTYDESESIVDVEYYESRYQGDFSILRSERNNDGTFTARLDTVNYSDNMNTVKMSKELVRGSKLAMLSQNTLFNVLDVNVSTQTVILQRIYGFDELVVGVSNLTYVDDNTKRNVNVPIRFNEHMILFISSTHLQHGTMSGKSKPILLSSKEIQISAGGDLVSVDDYIKASNGTDIKVLLQSLVSQSSIPLKFAVTPNKPQVDLNNFKVVQINKHIVEGSDVEYIKKLYAQQNKIKGEMNITVDNINNYNNALEQSNYKNESDRKEIAKKLENEKAKYKTQQQEYSTTVGELSNKDIGLYASTYAPKYRVRGFWAIQDDMTSEYTRNQVILAYRVQFRYVSANNKIANSENFSLVEDVNGEQVETTGAFSVWQEFVTPLRKRIIQKDGTISYQPNNIADANQINLNQLDIAIQKNEQIDVRIQAISEVGYPNVLVQSDWSDTVRVNFPPEFTTDIDFAKLQNEVNEAKQEVELYGILENNGLIHHVQNSMSIQHTYFAHPASSIDSGFVTPELNRINLFDKISTMQQEIEQLKNTIVGNTNTLNVSLEDEFGNNYAITNNGTHKVFAGYYTDKATLEPKGDIINFQMYIKLSNAIQNTQIYSLNAGDSSIVSDILSYSNVPVGFVQDEGLNTLPLGTPQTKAQIAYLRERNIINNDDLYVDNTALVTPWSNTVPAGSINTGATDPEKNVLHINGANIERIGLNNSDNTSFIAMSTRHPKYNQQSSNQEIRQYLQKLSTLMTFPNGKQINSKTVSGIEETKVSFAIDDEFLVGELTTGSYLTFNSVTNSQLKVAGNAIDSFKEVTPNGDVLIPILFQYRMTDALGRINGKPNVTDTNVTYTKRIGVDMLINGIKTMFDIEVSAKYTPSALNTNNIPKVGSLNTNNGNSLV